MNYTVRVFDKKADFDKGKKYFEKIMTSKKDAVNYVNSIKDVHIVYGATITSDKGTTNAFVFVPEILKNQETEFIHKAYKTKADFKKGKAVKSSEFGKPGMLLTLDIMRHNADHYALVTTSKADKTYTEKSFFDNEYQVVTFESSESQKDGYGDVLYGEVQTLKQAESILEILLAFKDKHSYSARIIGPKWKVIKTVKYNKAKKAA